MPTYQYRCTECGHDLEAVQKFSDASLTECPNCGGRLRKVYNAVGVVFKGSGFYKTDSRSNGSTGSSSAAKSGSDSAGDSSKSEEKKSDSSGEKKSGEKKSSEKSSSAGSSAASSPVGSSSKA